ncbi:PAS domain-containing protein [Phaeobacter sp. 22II1-1F12B]|uniref:PAS domain-containing protein n=1 Tax=Phaeobacter sp. 22II1-1F12B TaxID=1317111 RepID=UPI000B5276BB|nr:PAS domain-containing protein [Phaeobacter sp. 22II1-1F12B]OWU78977.1 diguanylate cyclase [Phaeobacter sp. 22II1-1F12B]
MTTDISELPASLSEYFEKSGVALALSRQEDDVPLVLVNKAFCDLTGYEPDDVIGKNCRLLQGPDTKASSIDALHEFVHDDSVNSGRFPILNYRKDGSSFHNFVFMTRLRDRRGKTQYILASQFNLGSAIKRTEIEKNDRKLNKSITDVESVGRDFGLAMMGSAEILADSIATVAKLSLNEEN